jgi:hypothetical protein
MPSPIDEPSRASARDARSDRSPAHLQRRRDDRSENGQVVSSLSSASEITDTSSGHSVGTVSDAEIAQLLFVALDGALQAFGSRDPQTFLQLHAYHGRAKMREVLTKLPLAQATDQTVRQQYRKAILFQKITHELGMEIMGALARYAKAQSMI